MFIIALRFWTAPVYLNYRLKINALITPFGLPVIIYAENWDIKLLGLLVFWMNLQAFWYHLDPPSNIY